MTPEQILIDGVIGYAIIMIALVNWLFPKSNIRITRAAEDYSFRYTYVFKDGTEIPCGEL